MKHLFNHIIVIGI